MKRLGLSALALGVLVGMAPMADAATFVLDGDTGADYDSVGDGWFFTTPPGQPPDGVGDLGNQALAVAYQSGVVELRAMAEFPLTPLSGVQASHVLSATLRVTIDDVLGTFGPGTTFDGTAANPLVAFAYPADGTVTVSDFAPAGMTEIGQIVTGAITDASLALSGAVSFDVDVTDELKDALTDGDAAFGALFATLDDPTGTSLDDLGVSGAALPVLTIETIALTPPAYDGAQLGCQTTLSKEGAKLQAAATKAFAGCLDGILKEAAKTGGTVGASTTAKCGLALDPANPNAKLTKAVSKFTDKAAGKCAGVAPADVGSPCDAGAATIADTVACVGAEALRTAQQLIGNTYGSACTLLASVGLDGDFPAVCAP